MLPSDQKKIKESETILTWYGLKGTVIIDDNLFHRSGLGRFVVRHPGLVNRFIRQRLSKSDGQMLTYRHEWAHLQSVPIVVIYLITLIITRWHIINLLVFLTILVVGQALWEFSAELFVAIKWRTYYFKLYRKRPLNPIIFALTMIGINWIYWWKS